MSDAKNSRLIMRYSAGQRANHWIVAITCVLAALSGLALFHPSMYWLTGLFGGGPWTRILHPFIGVVMVVFFAIFAARMWRNNIMRKHDWDWVKHGDDVVNRRHDKVPEADRYNAGQKLIYFLFIILTLGVLITGIVMWREFFWAFFNVGTIRLASVLHAFFALIFVLALIIHIYAGIWVKGSVRAMTRGTVTPGWAWKHHRIWYRKLLKDDPSK